MQEQSNKGVGSAFAHLQTNFERGADPSLNTNENDNLAAADLEIVRFN